MAEEINLSYLSTVGANIVAFGTGIGTGALLVVGWFTKQRDKILLQVANLQKKLDTHVAAMDKAHNENATRLNTLEDHVEGTERRLDELVDMTRELTRSNQRQMEILVTLASQLRK